MAATPKRGGAGAPPAGGPSAPDRPARTGRILPAAPPQVKPETPAPAAPVGGRVGGGPGVRRVPPVLGAGGEARPRQRRPPRAHRPPQRPVQFLRGAAGRAVE